MGNCHSGGSGGGLNESDERPLGGRGNGGGEEYVTVQPFNIAPTDLREGLGTKSKPLSIQDAIEGANPFYRGGAQGDFSENCQRAVIAYEMRRRGYDVVALPTYAGDKLPSGDRWRGALQGAKAIDVGSTNPKTAQANLEAQMKSFGKGSRGIVEIPGHVFNCENVNGKIRYVDAQTNTVYNSDNVFKRLGKKAASVQLIRTDNLRVSDRAKKSVTPSNDLVKRLAARQKNKGK